MSDWELSKRDYRSWCWATAVVAVLSQAHRVLGGEPMEAWVIAVGLFVGTSIGFAIDALLEWRKRRMAAQ